MKIAIHDYAGHPFQLDLSRALARRGHTVGHFYFAGDKGPKGATRRLPDDPESFSIQPIYLPEDYSKTQFIRRAISDMNYGREAAKQIAAFAPDVVLSANTPLESQRFLLSTTHAMNSAFIFWMQDFYSLAVQRLFGKRWFGLGWAISQYYLSLEKKLLKKGDAIVYISHDFAESSRTFNIETKRTEVIPNWASIENIPERPKRTTWSEAQGLADRFVFLYSGTLALKHNPQLLYALAERYVDRKEVVVTVAAHGVGRDKLEAELAQRPLPNLKLLPLQPMEDLPDMMGAADVVVALLERDAGEFSVPSKVLSYYCAARPVLMCAPAANLSTRTTLENGCGLAASPEDLDGFLNAADDLLNDAPLRERLGRQARQYAEQHFRIDKIADRFEALLAETVAARR